ncbi:MAG: alpha/beta fold hydrolase [Nitrospinota bacterium]|nr:alpha/beta fold hydrolase [Nitrospinota bacterium]
MSRLAGESPRVARFIKFSPPGTDEPVILCCEVTGKGPPLVLVPDLGDTVWAWRHLIPQFQARLRIIAVEPRGAGRSSSPAGPYTLPDLAGDLGRLAEGLQINKPIFVGHGLGGQAALTLAIEHPGLPAALVLAGAGTGSPPEGLRGAVQERMRCAERKDMRAAFQARKAEGRDPRGMTPRERAEYHRIFLQTDPAGHAASCAAALNAPDLTARLPEVGCPTLVLVGEKDAQQHESARRLAEGIPGCEAAEVEGAGHFAQLDRAEAFYALVEGFLRKHGLISLRHADRAR